jgi:hypothetical protein
VNVFRVHGIDASEKVVVRRQLRRSQVLAFFKALPPSLIGMEACATAHYWARELTKLGHTVRLMPAKDVKGLRQAQQERCRRCRGDLRGGATSDHAFCADQITRAAGPVDAASRACSCLGPISGSHQDSGHSGCIARRQVSKRKQAGYMAAPRRFAKKSDFSLAPRALSIHGPKCQFAAVQRYRYCRWNTGRSVDVADTDGPDPKPTWLERGMSGRDVWRRVPPAPVLDIDIHAELPPASLGSQLTWPIRNHVSQLCQSLSTACKTRQRELEQGNSPPPLSA